MSGIDRRTGRITYTSITNPIAPLATIVQTIALGSVLGAFLNSSAIWTGASPPMNAPTLVIIPTKHAKPAIHFVSVYILIHLQSHSLVSHPAFTKEFHTSFEGVRGAKTHKGIMIPIHPAKWRNKITISTRGKNLARKMLKSATRKVISIAIRVPCHLW